MYISNQADSAEISGSDLKTVQIARPQAGSLAPLTDLRSGIKSLSCLVVNEGAIKTMALPEGWTSAKRFSNGIGQRYRESFRPPGEREAEICVFYRAMAISDEAANAFRHLIGQGASQTLTRGQIIAMQEVMGITSVGDNQHTNSSTNPRFAPRFHLRNACTTKVQDRVVLLVEGNFQDESSHKTAEFKGIFVDTDGTGKMVQEIYYQAPQTKFARFLPWFEKCLAESMEWKSA